ncbi:RING finger protein 183-like [Arapaima gigas]
MRPKRRPPLRTSGFPSITPPWPTAFSRAHRTTAAASKQEDFAFAGPMSLSNLECPVCFLHYSRQNRVPRRLNCCHTFCTPCLEHMAQWSGAICTIRCPLCRWTTCMDLLRGPQEALWVDTEAWECISDFEEEDEEAEEKKEGPCQRVTPSHPRRHRNIPKALREFSLCIWPQNRTSTVQHEPLFKIFKNFHPFVCKSPACSSTAACQKD